MSASYLKNTTNYWSKGYDSENVESHLFRVYGRVLKNLLHENSLVKVLDYGCGQGSAVNFLHQKGLQVYGVDISPTNIEVCRGRFPQIADRFELISPEVDVSDLWFQGNFDLVTAIQVLYYHNPSDLKLRLKNLYDQMNVGSIVYATMMGSQCWYYDYAAILDDGMYRVDLTCDRFSLTDYRLTFMHSEDELLKVFDLFTPLHVGHYSAKFRSDEGQDFHYTFIGQKS